MAILLSLLAIALLALIVYLLHNYQQQQKIDLVDRTSPLPPLDDDIGLVDDQLAKDIPQPPVAIVAPSPQPAVSAPTDWLVQSRTLKDEGHFEQALEIARSAYPQIGAFRQACVILRAQLREQRKMALDHEAPLRALYHTCAVAAFLHARDDEMPPLSLSAQRQLRDRNWLQLPMPYDQLGTLHLDLLTTTDVKMLTAAWGKPSHHQQVRQFHANAWNALQDITSEL